MMERRSIAIQGTVQGVGFRPFVYKLASAFELGGFVRNFTGGVTIEVEGESQTLDQFIRAVVSNPPPLARIERWTCQEQIPKGDRRFQIEQSAVDPHASVVIAADTATCDQCVAELLDPVNRRYRYPFLNCTNCGPRLSIVTGAPYDRHKTTMALFKLCPECRAEYEDPTNRRFHAQPTACAVCGPSLSLLDSGGRRIDTEDPLGCFVSAIRSGKIGALKGLGGYHLVCDARDSRAIAMLRQRKHRDEKPLAIMVGDLAAARLLCVIDAAEEQLLLSPARPIVLLRKRAEIGELKADAGSEVLRRSGSIVEESGPSEYLRTGVVGERADRRFLSKNIAGDNPFIGVMLPYTPLHHLLLHDMPGVPLVMTSGNRSDEPIAYDEPDAIERLGGIADLFLTHNRPINVRCDDSVMRVVGGHASPIRRSRGLAPQPIALPINCPAPILAVGGQLKATFALASDRRAIISQHMGDLDHFEAFTAYERDIELYERLFSLSPRRIACDMHPDYASTRYARRREAEEGIECIGVQHHHAHMASCMAEHGLTEPVIGVTFDGAGFGPDGAIWGGEFLVGDYRGYQRAAQLRYVGMPGGESAVREPWRMAVAHLLDAEIGCEKFEREIDPAGLRTVRRMIERKFNTPMTSSAGRLFDAIAAMIGRRQRVSYEGQAAIELEWMAARAQQPVEKSPHSYPFNINDSSLQSAAFSPSPGIPGEGWGEGLLRDAQRDVTHAKPSPHPSPGIPREGERAAAIVIDTRPLIRAVVADVGNETAPATIARKFHSTLTAIIVDVCRMIRSRTGVTQVVLSGGVFMNALLSLDAESALGREGFDVYRHRLVPPGDGGLSLGQAAIAASRLAEK